MVYCERNANLNIVVRGKRENLIGTEILMTKCNSQSAVNLTSCCPRWKRYRLAVSFVLRPFLPGNSAFGTYKVGGRMGPTAGPDSKTPVIFMINGASLSWWMSQGLLARCFTSRVPLYTKNLDSICGSPASYSVVIEFKFESCSPRLGVFFGPSAPKEKFQDSRLTPD